MKRYSLVFVFCFVVVLLLGTASLAVFPKPDGYVNVQMKQGFYMDDVAWYFCSATDSIDWAKSEGLTLAPKLHSYLPPPFPPMSRAIIFVTNPASWQGPIFSQRPNGTDYSGVWQVVLVTWKPGTSRRPITNNQPANAGNPYGIPVADVVIQEIKVALDCPILALGKISRPWLPKPDPPYYRIRQAIAVDPYMKWLTLPYWNVYCDDPITHAISIRRVLITDAVNPAVVAELGTNLAPRLALGPNSDAQRFWEIIPPGPPSQIPVIEDCPTDCSWRNANFGYSPVMNYSQLQRDLTPPDDMAVSTVVNNDTSLLWLLGAGRLDLVASRGRINAHVLCW